jgi:8-oxo-dGTP pyrophosphatase MutT (NUDIX family)
MKQTTLCLLIKGDKICLAMKKRGFGVGRWNGTGGKFDPEKDKNILDAAIRETKEEIGVQIQNPEKVGLFHFYFPHKPEWNQDVSLFLAKEWVGEPSESEEMMPRWFSFSEIPYDKMWDDDTLWLPHILDGKKLEADFTFAEGDKIEKHNIEIVSQFI